MTYDPYGSGDFGASPFDDIFARFFGGSVPQRPAQRIDIGQLLTEQARELVRDAATAAARWGDPDLDTDHLLWAATRQEPVRRLLTAAGADPDAIAGKIEAGGKRGEPRQEAPNLTPSSKRALLDARQVSRALGSSYIGPEHLLFALAVNPESAAGRHLREARVTPEALQEAAAGGGPGAGAGQPPSDTPTVDEFSTDLTAMARDDQIDPVIGRASEIGQRTTRCSSGSPASARPLSRRASRSASSTATCPTRCATSAWSGWTWPAWSPGHGTAATSRSG
jgi:ATP-dependent Clp protease ATP-binding subunit ClpC